MEGLKGLLRANPELSLIEHEKGTSPSSNAFLIVQWYYDLPNKAKSNSSLEVTLPPNINRTNLQVEAGTNLYPLDIH